MRNVAIPLILLASHAIASAQTTQPATPPSPESRLNQMLQPPAGGAARPLQPAPAPSIDRTSGSAAVAPGAPTLTVLREGTFLVDRTGRLTRAADGQTWEFSFEADGRTMKDPPVIILPNLKLMNMEEAVKGASRDLRFRVTGMVTEYKGRNYLLLEKVLVMPDAAQQL